MWNILFLQVISVLFDQIIFNNFQNVYILNGGLKKWLELNYQTDVYDKDEIEHEITETNEIKENEFTY